MTIFLLTNMTLFTLYGLACNVRWLGVRGDDLQLIPVESMAPLKPKDLQIAKSLISLKILPVSGKSDKTQEVHFCLDVLTRRYNCRSHCMRCMLQDDYQQELSRMTQSRQKTEIEALYYHGYGFLGRYLAKKIVQADYI